MVEPTGVPGAELPVAPGPGAPTSPIDLPDPGAATARLQLDAVAVPDALLERLRATGCRVDTGSAERAEASRDWWPLAMTWAAADQVAALGAAVVRPDEPAQVAAVLRLCDEARVPVTAAGGRSGVVGGVVPLRGGVVLELCGLAGVRAVDVVDRQVDVGAGTFGDRLEQELRAEHGLTVGHWPQSVALSTVGGWLACRGAGQLSNRYGKVEDLVVGLDVVLADGTEVRTGGHARAAVGPDLTQLFVGSEGTLGVITGARLRVWPVPAAGHRAAYGFATFADGVEACRRIVQRGLSPAALRLYDPTEADRSHGTGGLAVLLVVDEGDPVVVAAATEITEAECAGAERLDDALVERWWTHRNDVSALEALIAKGYVVDTMEMTGRWSRLVELHGAVCDAIGAVDGVVAATGHLSHSYPEGACLYVTFGGVPASATPDGASDLHRRCWEAGTRAALDRGASLSHHHGVGVQRAPWVREALGAGGLDVLGALKAALDPHGTLNPGKLGLPSRPVGGGVG